MAAMRYVQGRERDIFDAMGRFLFIDKKERRETGRIRCDPRRKSRMGKKMEEAEQTMDGLGIPGSAQRGNIRRRREISEELTILALDIWMSKETKAQSTEWVAMEEANCQSTIQKIMGKAAKGDIIPYYDE